MFIKNNDINFLLNLVEITGKEILIFYTNNNLNIKLKTMEYDSPVTTADKLANQLLMIH